jgi:Bardet-Biedl syndrome 7 protein
VLYGTADGKVGLVTLGREGPETGWLLEREGGAGVQAIDNFDITGDGVRDLIVARHDGSIEVYSYDDGDEVEPTLRTTHNCGESITGLEGGVVGQQGYEEVVVATYTGKVFGLSSLPSGGSVAGGKRVSRGEAVQCSAVQCSEVQVSQEAAARLARLRTEVEELGDTVGKERERYQAQAVSSLGGMSAIPRLAITDKMTLNQTDASYMLRWLGATWLTVDLICTRPAYLYVLACYICGHAS